MIRLAIPALLAAVTIAACLTPAQTSAVAGGGASLVQCVSSELAKGDDTFEGIAAACGGAAIAEVVGVVETLAVPPDAGAQFALQSSKAQNVRHRKAAP